MRESMGEPGSTHPWGSEKTNMPYKSKKYYEGRPDSPRFSQTLTGPESKGGANETESINASPKELVLGHIEKIKLQLIQKYGVDGAKKLTEMYQNCENAFKFLNRLAEHGNLDDLRQIEAQLKQYIDNNYQGTRELGPTGLVLKSVTSEGDLRKHLAMGLRVEAGRLLAKLEKT